MTVTSLTPAQAAKRASVSRGTIMNAINDGSLTAFRDNRNRWQIDPDNLSKWLSGRGVNDTDIITVKADNADTPRGPVIDENAIRVAVLEAELKAKEQRISDLEQDRAQDRADFERERADLKRDRDAWKDQAQELAQRPKRWWHF